MGTIIRMADGSDLAAIEAIVAQAYAGYVPRIGRKPGPMLDDYAAQIAAGRVRVLEDAGEVRGLLVLIPQEDAMLIDNVAVDPAAQGMGFGRRLMEFAEGAARVAGLPRMRLYTNEAMVENIALYARLGYRETRRRIEMDLRRVYMEKELS